MGNGPKKNIVQRVSDLHKGADPEIGGSGECRASVEKKNFTVCVKLNTLKSRHTYSFKLTGNVRNVQKRIIR